MTVSGKSLIAMCTAKGGEEMHWEVLSERDKTLCPCWDCDCTPRLYVAVEEIPMGREIVKELTP